MFADAIKQTIMITSFVLVMMLIIEYINIQSKGQWSMRLQKSKWMQIIISALLGIIPGCLGSYTAVSLYTHNIINFSALVSGMIATLGDESFIMLSLMPGTAFKLILIVFLIAVVSGFIINMIDIKYNFNTLNENHYKHEDEEEVCNCYVPRMIIPQLRNITFQRALLITFNLAFIVFLFITADFHGTDNFDWEWIGFLAVSLVFLFIVVTVPEHFIEEHLWEHIIKKHLPKIFLWTLGAIVFIHLINYYLGDIEGWLKDNQLYILLIAMLIGIIPESGPHIIFITLFMNGTIPFSILLANSIVQDGHGALPLFAESKKSFFAAKFVKIIIASLFGLMGFYMNW